jgi:carboxypeptidase Q
VDIRRADETTTTRDAGLALEALAPIARLLEPIEATMLSPGGSGADIGPLVEATGVLGLGLRNDMSLYWHIHHTRADTFDKIDPTALRQNVAAVTVAAWMLAEMDERPWEGPTP